MANPLKIRFNDGTYICVLCAYDNPVYNDSKFYAEDELYWDSMENFAIFCCDRSNVWHPSFDPAQAKIDEAGNTWRFATDSANRRARITITDPNNVEIWNSGLIEGRPDTNSPGYIYALQLDSVTDADGNYQLILCRFYPSYYRTRLTNALDGSFANGYYGEWEYYLDVEIADQEKYVKRIAARNTIDPPASGGFLSADVATKRVNDTVFGSFEVFISNESTSGTFYTNNKIVLPASIVRPDVGDDTDPYSQIDGEGDIPGGGSVAIPGLPPATATATGIIGLFAPTESQMQQLADFMWTDFGGQGTTVVDVLKELVEAIKRTISNPLDYVFGLNIIPSQGLSIGSSQVVKFGFVSSGVSMPRLANQYFEVDCGSLSFDALCGDTFLDYAPYSKFSIYLPYIGFKDVDANDFVGHTIGVKYHGDTVTGGVTAYITKDGSVMYQYSGCCALNIPLSSDNWGSTIAATVQIATAMISGGVAGGAAGVGKAAINGAANVAANPSLLSPQVQHSGAVSGGAGAMGVQFPFVIREAVRFHPTTSFNKMSGYPSFYYRQLSNVTGYTTVLDVHLDGIPATRGEVMEIENLLKSGVIL